jgi:chemotaxis protein CheX
VNAARSARTGIQRRGRAVEKAGMQSAELAEALVGATADVFSTMLSTQLHVERFFDDPEPLWPAEVSAFIAFSGVLRGCVALHASRAQCRDFTARLLCADLDSIKSDEELRDAVGEIANMIAGNVKRVLARHGPIEIGLPAVALGSREPVRMSGAVGVVVPLSDYTGTFHVELVIASEAHPG